ncbi:MAG: 50S ribosomal protein L29 [Victivallaceae bacterium]|nr:50S ribosomal protein L29 [Victivallaceae bacterium]
MKMKDIRQLTDAELNSKLSDLKKEKLNLRIQAQTGQLEKTASATLVRRDIARIKTEQNTRLAQANG